MAKTNAQRQAEWRDRRKQELQLLRQGVTGDGHVISQLSEEEFGYLKQMLSEFRTRQEQAARNDERFELLRSVVRLKVELDLANQVHEKPGYRKLRPASTLTRDLFEQ